MIFKQDEQVPLPTAYPTTPDQAQTQPIVSVTGQKSPLGINPVLMQ